jgi:hypothetical protein
MSAWVSTALTDLARKEQRLALLRQAVENYEAEFGEITAEELAAQRRGDREQAVIVRGRTGRGRKAQSA